MRSTQVPELVKATAQEPHYGVIGLNTYALPCVLVYDFSVSMLRTGTRLGPYEILGPLGTGGMGEVYKAVDTRLRREVAIKALSIDGMSDLDRRNRVTKEARAASALNHPGIVTIHDIRHDDGVDFIVMEYVRGLTLDRVIGSSGMRVNEAIRIAIQSLMPCRQRTQRVFCTAI